jgi:ligand-binding SRPBCC domain-containing protein
MRVHLFRQEQFLPQPVEDVFTFFSRPENLEHLTPPWLNFTTLTPSPIPMRPGALVDYTLKIKGVPVHWRTLITEYEPPHFFVDQQLKGPYAMWHHRHTFESADGGTQMTDEVHYAMPFGVIGSVVNRLMVRRDVAGIFGYREKVLAEMFGESEVHAAEALAGA